MLLKPIPYIMLRPLNLFLFGFFLSFLTRVYFCFVSSVTIWNWSITDESIYFKSVTAETNRELETEITETNWN
jgi:uncharacterized membrane protein YvlD (DUF360 family)